MKPRAELTEEEKVEELRRGLTAANDTIARQAGELAKLRGAINRLADEIERITGHRPQP